MARKVLIGTSFLIVLGVAFFSGLAVGHRRAFRWTMGILEDEVVGSQNYRLSQLALIRSDDAERAVQVMETQADAVLSSLPRGREWGNLPESVRNTLVVSKKYRELYPPAEPSVALEEALASIPDLPLDPKSCSPAVRHLLEGGMPSAPNRP